MYHGCMSIYVEYVIIDNFVVDMLILYLVARSLHLRSSKWRIIIGSCIGTVFALISPFLNVLPAIMVAFKLLLGGFMVFELAKYKCIKQIGIAYLAFLSYTFLLGGACIGVLGLFNANITSMITLTYSYKVPVGLLILIIWIYVRIIIEISKYINRRKEVKSFLYDVIAENENIKLNLSGFLDSGNHLYDEKESLPVIVVNKSIFFRLFPDLKDSRSVAYDAHYIYYSTVSGYNQRMLVARPSSFKMVLSDGEVVLEKNVLIGLSNIKLEPCYDCLLHPSII